MSNKLLTAVWDNAPYYGGTLLVYLALADQASDEGIVWPSMTTIAAKARMNVRNARAHIAQLVRDGAVKQQFRPGKSTIYHLQYPTPGAPLPEQDEAPRHNPALEPGAKPTPVARDLPHAEDPTPVACDLPPRSRATYHPGRVRPTNPYRSIIEPKEIPQGRNQPCRKT